MSQKLKVIFSKTGDMRFISHLDLMRMFQRASRRADLPVAFTKGFSPHLRIGITRALKLGIESENEEAVFYMDDIVDSPDFIRSINDKLPGGVKVESVEEIK